MNVSALIRVLFVMGVFCATAPGFGCQRGELGPGGLLPRAGDVEGWLPEGEADYAEGADLYLLINGGAEIYLEYGFKEAVIQRYSTANGEAINLEIYEMENQTAAYGMYTFKTGGDGSPIDIGHDGWLESYYLNFWKGDYLVTVVGFDTDTTTLAGVKNLARAVDRRLTSEPTRLRIVSCLPKENLATNGVTYLRGNLALFNQYRFGENDVFALKEGVVGKYDGYSVFVFQYGDEVETVKSYESARNHLEHSKRFSSFLDRDGCFEITDQQNNRLFVKHHREWILIVLGGTGLDSDRIFSSLMTELSRPNKDE